MQIVKYPPIYSPAFGEVVFQISATAEELLELDILANDQTTVIGKKRFRGSTLYRVNVAGYGRRQIEVTPQRPAASSFAFPDKRIINLTLRSGNVRAATVMSAGTKQLDSYAKLSGSPDTIPISASQQDEFTILVDDGIPLSAEARLTGPGRNTTLTAIASTTAAGLTSICLNMPHLDTKLRALGKGSLNDYETLEIGMMNCSRKNTGWSRIPLTISGSAGGIHSDRSIITPCSAVYRTPLRSTRPASIHRKDTKRFTPGGKPQCA